MKASEFKAKALSVMDEVSRTGEPVIITKNGRPVARLVAYQETVGSLFGAHRGSVTMHDDLIDPLDEPWDAAQ